MPPAAGHVSQTDLLREVAWSFSAPFTREELAWVAWQRHPERFGMPGYECPDTHRVYAYLYGKLGLIRRGVLRRVGDRLVVVR